MVEARGLMYERLLEDAPRREIKAALLGASYECLSRGRLDLDLH